MFATLGLLCAHHRLEIEDLRVKSAYACIGVLVYWCIGGELGGGGGGGGVFAGWEMVR